MPWQLDISTIDVGQGESSLIVARDTVGGATRTMLIDAGLAGYARTVHNFVRGRLGLFGGTSVDHIVVSHYDVDHSGGITALLTADNLEAIAGIVGAAAATAAAASAGRGEDMLHQVASAAAAATAAARGGYDDGQGHDRSMQAVNAGLAADNLQFGHATGAPEAARRGVILGNNTADNAMALNPRIVQGQARLNATGRRTGIAAGQAAGNAAARTPEATRVAFAAMSLGVPKESRFRTRGFYRTSNVIDIGDTAHIPADYLLAIAPRVLFGGNFAVPAPGVNRVRTSLAPQDLGNEILWNSGPNAMAAPANAPAIFVVANNRMIWRAPQQSLPITSGQPENDASIGLIVRFERFYFYTGGDLPSQGENLIATAIMNNGLPDPQGGNAFATPHRIAAFKCGHHGSQNSTSNFFLTTVQPRGAFISCGINQFGHGENHPAPALVNRLHGSANINRFFLTNCKYVTNHIPASDGHNQLTAIGNKSRVCGDNANHNLAVGRDRGDSRLYLSQAEAASDNTGVVERQFHVAYFDDDNANAGAFGAPVAIGQRTENMPF